MKVCVGAARAEEMVWVEVKMAEKINPYFLDREGSEELSFVTSTELRSLHETIHNLTNKLVGLEALQEDFKRTEDELMHTNWELKESLKTVNIVQVMVMGAVGVLWILILQKAK